MTRIWRALIYSMHGIKAAWQSEAAFRQELVIAAILIPSAFFLAPDTLSLILMVSSVVLVLIIELVNTAIEEAINRIGTEIHPLSKKAKDTASAAVLITLLNAAFIWAVILTS